MGWDSNNSENKFYEIDAENYRLNEINKPYEDSDNFSISDLSVPAPLSLANSPTI